MTKFNNIYKTLEKDRWFSTIWVALPENSREIIQTNLKPLLPYCEWISTLAGKNSRNTLHINLRYLGYSDQLDFEKVKSDILRFRAAIANVKSLEIELGKMFLWTKVIDGEIKQARINWEINNSDALKELHNQLLEIEGYYFFEDLEGKNFDPHISLGAVDLSKRESLDYVTIYLNDIGSSIYPVHLKNIALNLTLPEQTEVISLHY